MGRGACRAITSCCYTLKRCRIGKTGVGTKPTSKLRGREANQRVSKARARKTSRSRKRGVEETTQVMTTMTTTNLIQTIALRRARGGLVTQNHASEEELKSWRK